MTPSSISQAQKRNIRDLMTAVEGNKRKPPIP